MRSVSQPPKELDVEGPAGQTRYPKFPPGKEARAEVSAEGGEAECTDAAHALCKRRKTDGREMSMGFHASIFLKEKPTAAQK